MVVGRPRVTAEVRKLGRGDYRIVTNIEIDAPTDAVWSVLTDWEHLADWSPSFLSLTGDFEDRGNVVTAFRMLGITRRYKHELTDFIEDRQFGWSDPFLFGMKDHHILRVERVDDDRSRFYQTDRVYSGASFILGAVMARLIMRMHTRFNQALSIEVDRRNTIAP
ncbi:MAG: hypothetical protein DWP92_05075 [Armatimonadetes bacterium]|nr:MAG: hypothetical protein DWP92_05075 [Armatimonadota bacterium]